MAANMGDLNFALLGLEERTGEDNVINTQTDIQTDIQTDGQTESHDTRSRTVWYIP